MALLLAVVLGGSVIASEEPPATQQATLALAVRTESGDPVPHVPLRVDTRAKMHFGITDADGEISMTIIFLEGEEYIIARPSTGFYLWESDEQRQVALDRFHTLRKQYSFYQSYYITLTADSPDQSGIITAYDAVTVSGRLVNDQGEPLEGGFAAPPQLCYTVTNIDGTFELKGIRQNEAVSIFYTEGLGQTHVLELDAAQLGDDLDIGDLVFESLPTDSTISIEMTANESLPTKNHLSIRNAVALVHLSGDVTYDWEVSASGRAFDTDENANTVFTHDFSSGTWFVIPGPVGGSSWLMLRQALRDGKAAELEAAGVPKIVVPPGEHVEFTFSAADAWNALKSVVPEP